MLTLPDSVSAADEAARKHASSEQMLEIMGISVRTSFGAWALPATDGQESPGM